MGPEVKVIVAQVAAAFLITLASETHINPSCSNSQTGDLSV
jgi:hypothetical protein